MFRREGKILRIVAENPFPVGGGNARLSFFIGWNDWAARFVRPFLLVGVVKKFAQTARKVGPAEAARRPSAT
jgi:hypothetical protein